MTDDEKLAGQLTAWWNSPGGAGEFQVNAPIKLTECIDGRFHKKSFIGEEVMRPFGAYMGKKGRMILKFREVGSAKGHIEMTVNEATEHLDWFKDYYTDLLTTIEDKLIAETREIAAAKEEAADTEARRHADPLFGSW